MPTAVVVDGARKLDVADPGAPGCHLAAAEHVEVGGADDSGALNAEVGKGVAARNLPFARVLT
jgi:hypothetical protein